MKKIVIYTAFLAGGLLAFISNQWGSVIHSVAGIAIGAVVAYHLVKQRTWIRALIRRRSRHPEARLAAFNALFAVVTTVCLATGFPLWSDASAGPVRGVHALTALAFVLMILGHLFMNRRRIRSWLRRRRPAQTARQGVAFMGAARRSGAGGKHPLHPGDAA